MKLRLSIAASLTFAAFRTWAQVPVTTGSYFQDFGNADVTYWVNNSTYPGWYQNQAGFAGHVNVTNSAPVNSGGFYTYECGNANDQKIGSRGSGSTTLVRYGVVLRNQTGVPIISLRVSYRGYQLSLAQNGNAVNRTIFDYLISPSIPAISSSATGTVPALNFTQLQNSSVAGASQINGYPCSQSALMTGCVPLAIPLVNGSYILLRWSDVDDPNNDHHMAIDDVQVDFDLTGTGCAVLLPVELLEFTAERHGTGVRLDWATASEHDNDHFEVERSADGEVFITLASVPGAGNSAQHLSYSTVDPWPLAGVSYYRLRQVDLDGTSDVSRVIPFHNDTGAGGLSVVPSVTMNGDVQVNVDEHLVGEGFDVVDATGTVVYRGLLGVTSFPLHLGLLGPGWYALRTGHGAIAKVIITAQ